MKITCDIIKDLLPSYVDELLTEDSRKMVEEHLAECTSCRSYYDALKGADNIPAEEAEALEEARLDELKPLKKIKKKMNHRMVIASVVSVICAIVILFGVYVLLFDRDFYTPYEDAGITVTESGKIHIENDFSNKAEYDFADEHVKFFFVTDTFITQRTKRDQNEIETYEDDFAQIEETIEENVAGELVRTSHYFDEVYYPSKEYAEKLQDGDFMGSITKEEKMTFLEEMKAASVLLWERPKFVNGESNALLSVRFTAKVESLIEDKNLGTGEPRYAIVEVFQGEPMLFDVGLEFGKDLEVGKTYSFKMKDEFVELPTEVYPLEALISIYNLRLESVSEPTENQMGLKAVDVSFKKL
ncbi:MAG: zf-HC2 domain-containing protein [Eubacteriaceae bacterium]|nr:zf-HC2 domain-containing protein [Eubacteriaceae bacterium]